MLRVLSGVIIEMIHVQLRQNLRTHSTLSYQIARKGCQPPFRTKSMDHPGHPPKMIAVDISRIFHLGNQRPQKKIKVK